MDAVITSQERVNQNGLPTCPLPTEEDFLIVGIQNTAFAAMSIFTDQKDISDHDRARLSKFFIQADVEYCKLFEEKCSVSELSEKEEKIKNNLKVAVKEIEQIAILTGKSFKYIAHQVLPKHIRSINYEWCLVDVLNNR